MIIDIFLEPNFFIPRLMLWHFKMDTKWRDELMKKLREKTDELISSIRKVDDSELIVINIELLLFGALTSLNWDRLNLLEPTDMITK